MNPPDSIMVVLDKPGHDQVALERAVAIANAAGAHLHLVSFCWLPMVDRSDVFDTHQRRALRKSAVNERRRWVDGLVLDRDLSSADVDTEVVWTDDISGWVADRSVDAGYDLVVKSVHQSRSLTHTPLDWDLLRHCPIPLLLASARKGKGSGAVLATVDLNSRDAKHGRLNGKVIDAATRFTGFYGGKLHCMSVVELEAAFQDLQLFDVAATRKTARQNALERLTQMLSDYDVAKRRIHLPVGKVGHEVAKVASAIGADLIVVGTGARRGLGAVLLGRSAEKILSRAPCDVLAVHA